MKIVTRINLWLTLFFAITMITIVGSLLYIGSQIVVQKSSVQEEVMDEMNSMLEDELKSLAHTVALYTLSVENEMDRNMQNAANVVREVDKNSGYHLTKQDLEQLASETNMSDLYVTNKNGDFTEATEEKSIGMSILDIADSKTARRF